MVKLVFLCRRRTDIDHATYAKRLLDGHVPLALKHHPTMRRYVVNIVEHCPPTEDEIDSVGELSFASLEDFRERLYDSPAGEEIVHRDVSGFMAAADAYATTEHVQKSERAPIVPGTRSPGVKLLCPVRRRPDLTHHQFVEHWLERHVPLAVRHHPGLTRYVTNVVEERLSDSGADWDGFSELHFASRQDLVERMFDSPAGERIIREDIARFIGHSFAFVVAEYVQKADETDDSTRGSRPAR